MKLESLVEEYKRANPHWGPQTRVRVENHLGLLVTLLGRDSEVENLTKADFRRLRGLLQTVSSNAAKRHVPLLGCPPFIATKTTNDCIVWIKTFWKWLELSYDEITYNPTIALVGFKKGREPGRDAISDEHLGQWLASVGDSRDALLIRSLSLHGTRLGEMALALPGDVNLLSTSLSVRPNKTRSLKSETANRELPLHPSINPRELREALPFVRTTKGLAILSKRLNRSLNKVIDNPSVCVHSLRHWTATKLKETGCEDSLVADILGHKLATMTSRYAKPSTLERKRVAMARLSLPACEATG